MSVPSVEQSIHQDVHAERITVHPRRSLPRHRGAAANDIGRSDDSIYGSAKRFCDLVIALFIIAVSLPSILIIAMAIKMDSRGPVLFRQLRHGQHQKRFVVLKFRTMYAHPSNDGRQAVCEDERVTRIGRFLRKSSLDELPQIFNVVRGEMSLVGPRPHPVWLDDTFSGLIDGYRNRYVVKPGITGLAQITGCRGGTATRAQMLRRLDKDLEYIEKRSLALDMKILALTVPSLLLRRDAY
jgi:putative colanic acid biosysnthesis UDP-glucose lipid carrier transferase